MSEKSTMTNPKTFESPIAQKDGLLYINLKLSPLPYGQQLIVKNEEGGKQRAMIAPTHMDTSGPRPHSGNNDIWTTNNQGYIVRIHKRLGRALFTPFNNGCPINTGQLEDYRKTIIRQRGKEEIIIEDDYQQKEKDQNKIIEGSAWIGETWFKPKASASRGSMPKATTPRQIMQEHQKAKTVTEKKEEASTSKPETRHCGKQPRRPSTDIPGSVQHIPPPVPRNTLKEIRTASTA